MSITFAVGSGSRLRTLRKCQPAYPRTTQNFTTGGTPPMTCFEPFEVPVSNSVGPRIQKDVSPLPRSPKRGRALMIAFLIERLTEPGGSERQCIELARSLAKLGHQMTVMTVEGSLGVHEDRETDQEVSFIRIGASNGAHLVGKLHQKLGQGWEMIRLGIAARRLPSGTILVPHHYPAHWASFVATL